MPDLKQELLNELHLKLKLDVEGIDYEPEVICDFAGYFGILKRLNLPSFDPSLLDRLQLPIGITLPYGTDVGAIPVKGSDYSIAKEDGALLLKERGRLIAEVALTPQPEWIDKFTSDGTPMYEVGFSSSGNSQDKSIIFAYSTECSVKEKNETCLFCCLNGNSVLKQGASLWRNPLQIAETSKAAYDEGYSHLTITGGFVPERRELDYYLDTAEKIQEAIGRKDFNGSACIGAPVDLDVIEKYKEAGFSSIAFNTEVWTKPWFEVICPGKVTECGGYDNWLNAIKRGVEVFGRGNVRSIFVAGLQPKELLLEGIEQLSEWGVVVIASPWKPYQGSPLEGHRSPTVDWHWDIQQKTAAIQRKNGLTYRDHFNSSPGRTVTMELIALEEGRLYARQKAAENEEIA
ncbi:MAG: radical SAM protein [Clostridiales bacterium]|nr:radical SAM protein [Clostridiales bacterium]